MNWMQNRPLLILALAFIAVSGTALSASRLASAKELGIEVELRSGFRQDEIRIEGDNRFGGTAVSELSNTKIHHLELAGRAMILQGFYYRGSIAFGWYYDGELRAFEDGDDGPFSEYPLGVRPYELNGSVDGEMTFDVTGGIGYRFNLFDDRLQFAPLGGYSFHKNNVKTTASTFSQIDGNNFINTSSTGFDTEWIGPWLGFDATAWITPIWSILVEFEYHWVDFEGIQRLLTPQSRELRTGSGSGISWGVATRYRFGRRFSGELLYRGHNWDAETARSFKVKWDSYLFTAGLIVHF